MIALNGVFGGVIWSRKTIWVTPTVYRFNRLVELAAKDSLHFLRKWRKIVLNCVTKVRNITVKQRTWIWNGCTLGYGYGGYIWLICQLLINIIACNLGYGVYTYTPLCCNLTLISSDSLKSPLKDTAPNSTALLTLIPVGVATYTPCCICQTLPALHGQLFKCFFRIFQVRLYHTWEDSDAPELGETDGASPRLRVCSYLSWSLPSMVIISPSPRITGISSNSYGFLKQKVLLAPNDKDTM